ncbi:pyridoxal phosphate phosphatase PHOSPHO2 [Nylanderia fulva]|uniref:pyridoxal phosphate phosphatase PHOSPHO2 n=1 Tax=Nylanderia fulva TaxID=613905 RepID=UPI0010FB9875|nr:pyridoxal phosphate phosphatase PHOSPHO2 [Nylanderia fulva]XP_029157516.1 pyridoxal phosphate phosphatase PHOSPHO2 [Nylanderia fulva]XP_029157517.1 pyridoxal phosphate phosphatase PHOSPHO2 [Nylanderia fulva]XP_029157518.1 pyridoxal phosphate phosphatase PHOSPHO2 [Nylanderia fulva]XP_029157519.1 pyridoxal phosphate phosphatase PHOSPHO2 [Nylanderia fulva]
MHRGVLAAFDFDHTVCDDNTDVVARKLLPDERIPEDVKGLYKSSGWIVYMGRIMELLHENGIDIQQIEDAIVRIPGVAGIEELLLALHANGHEIIIISDSNSVFIDRWLRSRRLEHVVSRIFTNPAYYDDTGRMRVDMYHTQHTCRLSTVNLCKGQILMDYIDERREQGRRYERIVYVGDGKNDLCPILRLSQTDLACPRKGYALVETLSKLPRDSTTKARVVQWDDGRDLRHNLEQILKFR